MTTKANGSDHANANLVLSEAEFKEFQRMILAVAGIQMADGKRTMVAGRLAKRLKALQLRSYRDYWLHICHNPDEKQTAVDLLTTNETYFFREPKHFEFLRGSVLTAHNSTKPFRIWSAACSSGEEPYSLAMVLADKFGPSGWELLASDISTQVLAKARTGCYPISRIDKIPQAFLQRYCLRGVGSAEGTLLIDSSLRAKVKFQQINLNATLPEVGQFDVIFLRNVMIYFNTETKQKILARLLGRLRPGGYFIIGHSETLNGFQCGLKAITPSVYRALA